MGWLANQGATFRGRIEFGTLDLSGPYRHVFEVMVPKATLVADLFQVAELANTKLDGRDHGLLPRLDHRYSPVVERGGELVVSVGQSVATTSSPC
jgi:transposase